MVPKLFKYAARFPITGVEVPALFTSSLSDSHAAKVCIVGFQRRKDNFPLAPGGWKMEWEEHFLEEVSSTWSESGRMGGVLPAVDKKGKANGLNHPGLNSKLFKTELMAAHLWEQIQCYTGMVICMEPTYCLPFPPTPALLLPPEERSSWSQIESWESLIFLNFLSTDAVSYENIPAMPTFKHPNSISSITSNIWSDTTAVDNHVFPLGI